MTWQGYDFGFAQRELLQACDAWIKEAIHALERARTPEQKELARTQLRDARSALLNVRIMGPGA